MTVADLKIIVQQDVDDTIDPSVLLGWLNRGYEYLQQFIILPELETSESLVFTDGLATLPSGFLHFVELAIDGVYYRTEVDYESRTQYSADAKPYAFYFWGAQIGILPAVTATGTFAYVKQAATMTSDSETPKVPTIFQPLIAEYAKALYRSANGSPAKALAHFTEVDNGIDRLTGKLRRRVRRQSHSWGDIRDMHPNYP